MRQRETFVHGLIKSLHIEARRHGGRLSFDYSPMHGYQFYSHFCSPLGREGRSVAWQSGWLQPGDALVWLMEHWQCQPGIVYPGGNYI